MNAETLRALLRRLKRVEDTAVRYRTGVVSDTDPLSVKLGGSATAYASVRSVATDGPKTGDTVAVLVMGHDLLILGTITDTPRRTVEGRVAADGTISEGDGFTVSKTGTGAYTVTFTTAFLAAPAVAPAVVTGGTGVRIQAVAAGSFSILTYNASTLGVLDAPFHFIARGRA